MIRALMRLPNEIDRALRSLGIVKPSWDLEQFIASSEAGPDQRTTDNSDSFDEGLEALCKAARRSQNMSRSGRFLLAMTCKARLRARRQIALTYEQFPEIHGSDVERPLIVTGLPRSGTTFLHRLLALDPRARAPGFWEMQAPAPPTSLAVMKQDPRYLATKLYCFMYNAAIPNLPAIHSLTASGPEECSLLLQNSFASELFHAMYELPGYLDWLLSCDMIPAYQYYKQQLRILRWGYQCEWLALKSPEHLLHLDALLAALPEARIVFVHRRPAEALASGCSLMSALRSVSVDRVVASTIGEDATALLSALLERSAASRARIDPHRVYDVEYDQLIREPENCIANIYEHFGIAMTNEFHELLVRNVREEHRSRTSTHVYSLEQFGLQKNALGSGSFHR